MTLLSPADLSIPIAWEARDDAGTDLAIRVGTDRGSSAFVIRTMERTGQRMNDEGAITGTVDDPRALAELAVRDSLLAELDETYPPDLLRARLQEIADEARAVDWAEWEFTRIEVDGVGFALRVRRDKERGFVAIADLGRWVVTMRGKELPADRRFTLRREVDEPAPESAP